MFFPGTAVNLSVLEIIAAVLGVFAVGLTIGRNVWCWPIGLLQVILYTKIFYDAQLYSQMLLQAVFAFLQVHGWWQWRSSLREPLSSGAAPNEDKITVERISLRRFSGYVVLATSMSLILGVAMMSLTSAKWPLADACIAGFSLVAQWLLIHRQLENWYLWIFVNILTIIVCSAQELWPTVVLYIVFLGMAVHGLKVWHQTLNMHDAKSDSG